MLSAMVTGMIRVYLLRNFGMATLHPKPGSFGSSVIGGLIFGVGFGLLGYCPGTLAGAVGQGALDALCGGLVGILIGAGLFSEFYPKLDKGILNKGHFGEITWPQLLDVNPWSIIIPVTIGVMALLFFWMKIPASDFMMSSFQKTVPVFEWLRHYRRSDLNGDLTAGMIAAIIMISTSPFEVISLTPVPGSKGSDREVSWRKRRPPEGW